MVNSDENKGKCMPEKPKAHKRSKFPMWIMHENRHVFVFEGTLACGGVDHNNGSKARTSLSEPRSFAVALEALPGLSCWES